MRERRWKAPAPDDAHGWLGYFQMYVLPALKREIIEVPSDPECTAVPTSIYKMIMIQGFISRIDFIMAQLILESNIRRDEMRTQLRAQRRKNDDTLIGDDR